MSMTLDVVKEKILGAQAELNEIEKEIDGLKNEIDESKKNERMEAIEFTTKKLEEDIALLKKSITENIDLLEADELDGGDIDLWKGELKDLEAMVATFDGFKIELSDLKEIIVPEETKNRNRIQRQRDGVTTKEEWKNNPWANVARVAGGLGAVALVRKGVKLLFGGRRDKEEEQQQSQQQGGDGNLVNNVADKVGDTLSEKTGSRLERIFKL